MNTKKMPPSHSPVLRFLRRACALFLMLGFLSIGWVSYDAYSFLYTPAATKAGQESQEALIDIPPGATFDRVARDLYQKGAISDVLRFRLLAKWHDKLASVQAGEFAVDTGWLPEKILDYITSGNQRLYKLAIREGLPWWEVARLVEEGGFATAAEFEAVIHDPEFLRQYGIPFANAEGFLYPETYLLRKPRESTGRKEAETVARILVETFWKRSLPVLTQYATMKASPKDTSPELAASAQEESPSGHKPLPMTQKTAEKTNSPPLSPPGSMSEETLRYLVILASLVEKETGVPEERARVAGVYANRMRIGMLLQCDPTIIYGLGPEQKGPIRRSQLDDEKNRYNTYKHSGLPPGPICSPGAAAMRAAVTPEKHAYLYFVATGKPDGTHTFSSNITDHNKAVREFRKTQR